MATVWIGNAAGHPYEKVRDLLRNEENLEIKPLTTDDVNTLEIDRLNWHLARGIACYVRPNDYLLISGTPMVNAAAFALWLLQHGSVNLVQWNAKQRAYELRRVERGHLISILEQQLLR